MPTANWIVKSLASLISRTCLPRIDGQIRLAGLHQPVEILRDEWGVPHIFAQNLPDLFFAQGIVHAQDRLFQMDFSRRLVAGRLAEVLGRLALPLDRWMRTLTMRRVAEYEVSLLDSVTTSYLQAYANGVNVFLAHGRLPLEFTLLRYHPRPWVIADSLSWIKMMSWTLSVNWETEILRRQLIDRLGPELAAEMELDHLARWPFIIPPGSDASVVGATAFDRANLARSFTGPSPYDGLGSNNWVLAGERTTSGKPLLANDMHLGLTIPAIWYENHLCGGGIEVTGVIFPGIPGVISGHNRHVAWGFTNGFPDVQDLYMERLRRTPDGGVEAEYNGAWEPTRVLKENIIIKGASAETEEVIITRHGPIINSLAPDFTGEQPLALRWTSLEPDTMARSVFEMIQAADVNQFHQALRHWTSPTQNMVYADIEGNIAYSFPGKLPLRAKGHGKVPVPGWTSEYEWAGYVPFESLPHVVNPPQGYIVTANNRAFSDDFPISIELEPIAGDRAQRIAEMILDPELRHDQEKIDISFIQAMQFDQVSPSARIVARILGQLSLDRSAHTPETELHIAVQMIKEWDGTLTKDSPAAALYQVFIRKLAALLLSSHLGPPESPTGRKESRNAPVSLLERWMGLGPTPVLADRSLHGELYLPWLTHILANPDSHWFDLGNIQGRDSVLRLALEQALDDLKSILGKDTRKWKWGSLHTLTFAHSLAANPLMAGMFNRGPYPVGGDGTTIWATVGNFHNLDSTHMIGPPYRMIVDLSDLDQSLSMLSPGQSGHLASPHYDDQVQNWFDRGYHPMLINRDKIMAHLEGRLLLQPSGGLAPKNRRGKPAQGRNASKESNV